MHSERKTCIIQGSLNSCEMKMPSDISCCVRKRGTNSPVLERLCSTSLPCATHIYWKKDDLQFPVLAVRAQCWVVKLQAFNVCTCQPNAFVYKCCSARMPLDLPDT